MSPFLRTTVTIGGLLLTLFLAASWGWSQLTSPLPALTDEAPVCEETAIKEGDAVTPSQVTVSVLNASKRQGLASRTMKEFTDAGFHAGDSLNAPSGTGVKTAEIWTDDPASPAVKLVSSRLDGAKVVQKSVTQVGVVVVVGDKFSQLDQGKASVKATTDTTICIPTT
ncbi:MAG: LytR C-terminal domain-containing protein [Nocardioides sp.]|uniref:LytR C-terminal domain-containing protein n=1 Tax=Nocardioides sp. TaxID=35761 RepID=UPI0039E45555